MKRAILILAFTAAGCGDGCGDKVIDRRMVKRWQAEGVVSCSYSCWRYTCLDQYDWDDDGDRECGLHLTSCSGHQHAMLQFTEIETIYETNVGGAEKGHRAERSIEQDVLQRLEACK